MIAEKIHKRFIHLDLDFEELTGTLYESLVRSLDHFEPDLGIQFSTYACRVLWNSGVEWANKEGRRMIGEDKIKYNHETGEDYITLGVENLDGQLEKLQIYIDYANLSIKTKKQREIIDCYINNPTLKREEIAGKVGASSAYVKEVIRRYKDRIGQLS